MPAHLLYPLSYDEAKSYVDQGLSTHDIADLKDYPIERVRVSLRKHRLKAKRRRSPNLLFTPEQEERIRSMYVDEGIGAPTIALRMDADPSVVLHTLYRLGIPRRSCGYRTYELREDFFDIIDTEEKAYFLGLIYADGSMSYRKTKLATGYSMTLALQEEDGYMVVALRDALYPNHDIPVRESRNQVRLDVSSKRLFSALNALGCTPKKSLTLQFPTIEQVPRNLVRHFVRGYFDGDGSISWNTKVHHIQAAFNCVGSLPFCDTLKQLFDSLGMPAYLSVCKHSPQVQYVIVSKQSTLIAMFHYLYDGATIYLTRKRAKYDRLMVRLNERVVYWKARESL